MGHVVRTLKIHDLNLYEGLLFKSDNLFILLLLLPIVTITRLVLEHFGLLKVLLIVILLLVHMVLVQKLQHNIKPFQDVQHVRSINPSRLVVFFSFVNFLYLYSKIIFFCFHLFIYLFLAIPLENDGGSGTACGHWDETCFGAELMTGFAGTDTSIFSKITIGGVEDIGYTVNYDVATSYTSSNLDASCRCNRRRRLGEPPKKESESKVFNLGGHKRKLSEEGRAIAVEYGNQMLNRYNQPDKFGPDGSNLFTSTTDDVLYIGDKIINVLYLENGHVFNVMVSNL